MQEEDQETDAPVEDTPAVARRHNTNSMTGATKTFAQDMRRMAECWAEDTWHVDRHSRTAHRSTETTGCTDEEL